MPEYFSLDELRALPDVTNETKYPDERCEAAAAAIVAVIEREVKTSFVPREHTETFDGGGLLLLSKPDVRSIISVVEDGVAVTDRMIVRDGLVLRLSGTRRLGWAEGYDNLVVTYEAGYSDEPPADVKEQALKGTRAHLMATAANSAINDRTSSTSGEQGTTTFVMAGADRPTGYPEVDAMILGYKAILDGPSAA